MSDGKISATYNLASHSKLIERDFFQIAIFKQSSGGTANLCQKLSNHKWKSANYKPTIKVSQGEELILMLSK